MNPEYSFAVSRFKNRNGVFSWRVDGRLKGVRIRRNFKTQEEAAAEKSTLETKALRMMSSLSAVVTCLTEDQVREAEVVFRRLAEQDQSLSFCVDFALSNYRAPTLQKPLPEAMAEYVTAKAREHQQGQLSMAQLERIRRDLNRLEKHFPGASVGEVTSKRLAEFFNLGNPSFKTYNNRRGIVSTFLNFGFRKEWITENPILKEVLQQLRTIPVAESEELGIKGILSKVQEALRSFVPSDWAENPHMRVSDLARESLRKSLTVFMSTGIALEDGKYHAAPYQHQGTGTINTLVLALLSIIADLKQNVIFAMEEPEIAIPPHTQKRIINSVCGKSAQAIFTSHSPYVLAEFEPDQIVALRRETGVLSGTPVNYPPTVKPKAYQTEFRSRFCEALLARRVLIIRRGGKDLDQLESDRLAGCFGHFGAGECQASDGFDEGT